MPELPEDKPDRGESATPGVVPDWIEGNRIQGRVNTSFRGENEGQGPKINELLAREVTKESNLRARLTDLGVEKSLRDRCYVHSHLDPSQDTITMPWEVIYFLIESEYGHHRMGAM